MPPLILASESPRRLELLRQIGIVPSEVKPAHIDESAFKGELPSQCAKRLAQMKAEEISKHSSNVYILAADTIVACGRRMLGKPEHREEAKTFLSLLSGRRHRLYGGICLITPKGKMRVKLVQSVVKFKLLSKAEINFYLDSDEWKGKAGAYAIQGKAGQFIDFISGSYSNIVGLDLYTTSQLLKGEGFVF